MYVFNKLLDTVISTPIYNAAVLSYFFKWLLVVQTIHAPYCNIVVLHIVKRNQKES